MSKKRIGIKYCGYCNPTYDRKKELDALLAAHEEWDWSYAKAGETYDVLLLAHGCERACLRNYSDADALERIMLCKVEDYKNVL